MENGHDMARRLMVLGAVLVMLGLLTGFVSGSLANPRMGLVAHLEGLMNGTLMLALGAGWSRVHLSGREEGAAFVLLVFGTVSNWLATLLAAVWGVGGQTMPLSAAGRTGAAWQEALVSVLLVTLSFAMVASFALVLKGLLARRGT
ncbi:hypothetical protein OLX02_08385 [Novosphingobium sp. KCTC 2891]|uniref:hypothetical protein n=1 Tax=Novosphingobium sp. KCTC 2891 TaxID=2989730 RepID=UPI002221327F|nr:hypothetical protein [Novosphingobium sp. KCTC 2891]MCW1382840.1 hypothetical protein [Novosphingobium sp. KCTC 2891]